MAWRWLGSLLLEPASLPTCELAYLPTLITNNTFHSRLHPSPPSSTSSPAGRILLLLARPDEDQKTTNKTTNKNKNNHNQEPRTNNRHHYFSLHPIPIPTYHTYLFTGTLLPGALSVITYSGPQFSLTLKNSLLILQRCRCATYRKVALRTKLSSQSSRQRLTLARYDVDTLPLHILIRSFLAR